MKKFSYSLSMSGFAAVTGVIEATDKKSAEFKAVQIFLDRNDISESVSPARVRFYGPTVKEAK